MQVPRLLSFLRPLMPPDPTGPAGRAPLPAAAAALPGGRAASSGGGGADDEDGGWMHMDGMWSKGTEVIM